MIWFTSDTHFDHARALDMRPFDTVEAMNETLIQRWNEQVAPDDHVYHLGDFIWGRVNVVERAQELLRRLNGRKHLIHGNHDPAKVRLLPEWTSSQAYCEINLDGRFICLYHYAGRVWNRRHYGSYQLFGHSHGRLRPENRSIDVGVDCWDFTPVCFSQIRARLTEAGLNKNPVEADADPGH